MNANKSIDALLRIKLTALSTANPTRNWKRLSDLYNRVINVMHKYKTSITKYVQLNNHNADLLNIYYKTAARSIGYNSRGITLCSKAGQSALNYLSIMGFTKISKLKVPEVHILNQLLKFDPNAYVMNPIHNPYINQWTLLQPSAITLVIDKCIKNIKSLQKSIKYTASK